MQIKIHTHPGEKQVATCPLLSSFLDLLKYMYTLLTILKLF